MVDDKKKAIAALIVAKAKPAPEAEMSEEYGDEEGAMDGQREACEEMMQALEAKDPDMFKSALKAFLDMQD